MVSRHVMAKFYLWMLLSLTLSVAGAAAVVGLISGRGWESRLTELVLSEVRVGRDVAANLLRSGMDVAELERLLSPLTSHTSTTVAIVAVDGRPLAVFAPPEMKPHGNTLPSHEDIENVLEHGSMIELEEEGMITVGLPIELPSGKTGVFFVTHSKRHWGTGDVPWRILAGLGVFLGVLWLLSWPMATHLVRPMRDMARVARELGEGNLSARIRLRRHRRDEVGTLAASFNTMAGNLERMVTGHKQLLADISHELRSPLARLRVALELARRDSGAEGLGYLDRVESQADDMDALIEELLTHARLETAPHTLRTESVHIGRLLRDISTPFDSDAEGKGIDLRVESLEEASPVEGDQALLGRAVSNVLRNALAHCPPGGRVRLEGGLDEGRAWIKVSDTGEGVPPDMVGQIFEPFVRTDSARSPGTGGVGLGLAIARRCMEAHGGGAHAENLGGVHAENLGGKPEISGLQVTLWWPAFGPEGREED